MTHRANSIAARDIASVIHPQTNLQQHRTAGPEMTQRILTRHQACGVPA